MQESTLYIYNTDDGKVGCEPKLSLLHRNDAERRESPYLACTSPHGLRERKRREFPNTIEIKQSNAYVELCHAFGCHSHLKAETCIVAPAILTEPDEK